MLGLFKKGIREGGVRRGSRLPSIYCTSDGSGIIYCTVRQTGAILLLITQACADFSARFLVPISRGGAHLFPAAY